MVRFSDRFQHVDVRNDQDVLENTGGLLFGKRWKSPLALYLGVSQPYVSQVYSAKRALTAAQRMRLALMVNTYIHSLSNKRDIGEELEAYWRDTAARNYRPPNIKREGRDGPSS